MLHTAGKHHGKGSMVIDRPLSSFRIWAGEEEVPEEVDSEVDSVEQEKAVEVSGAALEGSAEEGREAEDSEENGDR